MQTMGFGPSLKQLLRQRGISASELARMMAYKSRNSIFRILDGEGGHGVRKAFYEKLTQEDPLSLSQAECMLLEQALEISRVGLSTYLSNRTMGRMLLCSAADEAEIKVRLLGSAQKETAVRRNMERVRRSKRVSVTIVGCCDRAIFELFRRELSELSATCEVNIRHFIYTGEEEIVQNIAAILPLLYMRNYEAYCVGPGELSRERERLYRCNCVNLHVQEENGKWFDQQFLLVDPYVFAPMRRIESEENDSYAAFFCMESGKLPPLKREFSRKEALESYLNYTKECLQMEQGRSIYTIKPDIPLSFVAPEILLPSFMDGVEKTNLMQDASVEACLEALKDVHTQRFENFFIKSKPTHIVFLRGAMERFARTGRQADHFFAVRPYTSEERVRILTYLREETRKNPHFSIHFLREGMQPTLMEVGLYEGVGVVMTKPNTDYNLASDHAETLITQEAFCQSYKMFFTQDLLERHVLGEQETLDVLDELIEIAKNA